MSMSLRWVLLVPATGAALVAAGVAGSMSAHALAVWSDPVILAAAVVVGVAYAMAPSAKLVVATCALLAGAWLAWSLIQPPSFYPESYEDLAYAPTNLPIAVTDAGGVAAWLACLWHRRRLAGRPALG